jgi:integrase
MIKINWKEDYNGEFICHECDMKGMSNQWTHPQTQKRQFRCSACKKVQRESCNLTIKAVNDPHIQGLKWYTNHKINGFVCPQCQAEDIYFQGIYQYDKKTFGCRTCGKRQQDSNILNAYSFSRYSTNQLIVKPFNRVDDEWDLRAINLNYDARDIKESKLDFSDLELDWFKDKAKDYILYLCKAESAFKTIKRHLFYLKRFSKYLATENISGFDKISRSLILDYLAHEKNVGRHKLSLLRSFFTIGNIKGWFKIDQDIIRNADYPKLHQDNPDPISDLVREQIEQNLYRLPDPIARMWLIGYFAAMRPSELALLKRDCLVQEGQYWKLVWYRKKTNDYHEIPISISIAKVIQEQQEYIQNLWGDRWDYLFSHYHNLSRTEPSQPKLKPVKKILPSDNHHPLIISIQALITTLNIRNENGQIPKFQLKLFRPTRLTQLFEEGHDLAVVSAWAGHKQFATTSTYYTKVSCDLMEREAGHIQQALVNNNGHRVLYESYPKSFWDNPTAHKLELDGTHINTPIYGLCGLPLDQDCHKFRACYTCQSFVATIEKLPQYINTHTVLREKQAKAMSAGQEVLVEQFGRQADQLDKIIASLQQEAA